MTPSEQKSPQSDSNGSTSRSLLERLRLETPTAWSELVQLYSPLIVYWCRKQGAQPHACEDILQDVFRTVFASIGKFRKEKQSDTFRGWLRTITRSRVIDYFRRNAAEPVPSGGTEAQLRFSELTEAKSDPSPIPDDELEDDPEEASAERELFLRAIELIREGFEEKTWQAFWRTTVDGQSAPDVAEELGMRPGTVRVAKSRVLNRLREQLGDLLE